MLFIHVYVVATIKKNETRSSMTRSKNRSQAVGKHHSKLQNIGVWYDKKGEIQRIRRETNVIQYRTECPQISPPSKRQTPLDYIQLHIPYIPVSMLQQLHSILININTIILKLNCQIVLRHAAVFAQFGNPLSHPILVAIRLAAFSHCYSPILVIDTISIYVVWESFGIRQMERSRKLNYF